MRHLRVFPEFDSKADIYLPEELYKADFETQKEYLLESLMMMLDEKYGNPELRSLFTAEELEDIACGIMPDGYVWHHNEEEGLMQLVDAILHTESGHTGGMSLWGIGHK